MVFSYHYKYEKYLRDNNLIDPEKARMFQEKQKRQAAASNDPKTQAKDAANLDGEDLMDEDNSHPGIMNGKHRYDNLIKTMIARIEYNNTLAPVQEYGRHQTKALKKKNKNKPVTEENEKKSRKDFDDRFYDLDD